MACTVKYIRISIFALFAFALHFKAFSQPEVLSQGDNQTVSKDSSVNVHSLFAGAGSGSNMIFLGSTISHDHPYFSTALTYGYKSSFYVSAGVSHINSVNPYIAFYNISLNYSHVFNSWFDISSGISGYATPSSLKEILFSDFAFINFTSGFDWKLIYTRVSIGGLISEEDQAYLQIRNSRYFETPEFFNGKGQVSFDPNINTLFGKIVKIQTVTGVTKYGSSPAFRHIKKNPNSTTETYSYKYGIMDFEFSLPVRFDYDKFSIEAEPSYILPAYTNRDYPSPEGFTFFLNVYFRIF